MNFFITIRNMLYYIYSPSPGRESVKHEKMSRIEVRLMSSVAHCSYTECAKTKKCNSVSFFPDHLYLLELII